MRTATLQALGALTTTFSEAEGFLGGFFAKCKTCFCHFCGMSLPRLRAILLAKLPSQKPEICCNFKDMIYYISGDFLVVFSSETQSRLFSQVRTDSYSCPVRVFSFAPRRDVIRMILPLASDSAGDVRSACATALASFAPLSSDEARRPGRCFLNGDDRHHKERS